MHTKKNASFIITIALSMIILAFISYCTVYEQILSKSNGFFNVIIFGVVLILVFIFITLLARIITLNTDNTETSPVVKLLIMIGILGIFALFVYTRLQYTSSVSPSESVTYKGAAYIASGNLAEGKEVHNSLIAYPDDFAYAHFMSMIFKATDSSPVIFTVVNIVMMLITSLFLFLTVNLIAGKACASIAIIFFMFMPNNTFLVYSYNSELFVSALFMISFFLYEVMIYKRFRIKALSVIISVFSGIFTGLCLGTEPSLIFVFIALTVWVIIAKRQSVFLAILPHIISLVLLIGMAFFKASFIDASALEVLTGMALCLVPTYVRKGGVIFSFTDFFTSVKDRFNNPSKFLNDNFYFLTNSDGKSFSKNQAVWLDIADQIIYIFMLILCVMCVVYILRVTYDKILPAFSVLIASFIGLVLGGMNNVDYVYFTAIITVIGSSTIYYMYLNHHSEYAVFITNKEIAKDNEVLRLHMLDSDEDRNMDSDENDGVSEIPDEGYLLRARALIFVGQDEELYRTIKQEEKLNRINNSVAATRIRTTINEEGEYDSIEEKLEFFDELDETPSEVKQVHEVKAIPATRPVEVVKPVLADDYYESQNMTIQPETVPSAENTVSFVEPVHKLPKLTPVQPIFAEPQSTNNVASTEPLAGGFVFRNKKDDATQNVNVQENIKPEKIKPEKIKPEKIKPEKKTKIKNKAKDTENIGNNMNPADVAAGEPLPNPMALPKPHVSKDLDFDFDISDNDDFDV